MQNTMTVGAQASQLIQGCLVLLAHICDLDRFMMNLNTSHPKIAVRFDRICSALLAE
jgi:hypothetical protein